MNRSFFRLFVFSWLLFSTPLLEAALAFGNLTVSRVKRVHDGDTFIVDIDGVHPLIGSSVSVRIKKIDTPEISDKREIVRQLAYRAKEFVAAKLALAEKIELVDVQRDKYFRILADVLVDGVDLGSELLEMGLAEPYDGKTKPKWDLNLGLKPNLSDIPCIAN